MTAGATLKVPAGVAADVSVLVRTSDAAAQTQATPDPMERAREKVLGCSKHLGTLTTLKPLPARNRRKSSADVSVLSDLGPTETRSG